MFEIIKKSKSNKQTIEVLNKLERISELVPSTDVLDFFNKLIDTYKEAKLTEREVAKIQAQKEVLITEIEQKYDIYHEIFAQIFEERKVAIVKSFEIIDKGLNEGNKELVSSGMQGLSKIVSTSPFANLEQLSRMIEGNKVIEI